MQRLLAGDVSLKGYESARAGALLPPLDSGFTAFKELEEKSDKFAALVEPHLGAAMADIPVHFEQNGISLNGILENIHSEKLIRWRVASIKARDRLELWVDHLLLNVFGPDAYPRESVLLCSDMILTLAPLTNAADLLSDLLQLYREGLRQPLPFFPQVSWLFVTAGKEKAEARWNGNDYSKQPGESSEPAIAICFGDTDIFNCEFELLTRRIFDPLLAVAQEVPIAV